MLPEDQDEEERRMQEAERGGRWRQRGGSVKRGGWMRGRGGEEESRGRRRMQREEQGRDPGGRVLVDDQLRLLVQDLRDGLWLRCLRAPSRRRFGRGGRGGLAAGLAAEPLQCRTHCEC